MNVICFFSHLLKRIPLRHSTQIFSLTAGGKTFCRLPVCECVVIFCAVSLVAHSLSLANYKVVVNVADGVGEPPGRVFFFFFPSYSNSSHNKAASLA